MRERLIPGEARVAAGDEVPPGIVGGMKAPGIFGLSIPQEHRGPSLAQEAAMQIHGGSGYMAASAVERFYRDVRLLRLCEGASPIRQPVIARQMGKRFHGR